MNVHISHFDDHDLIVHRNGQADFHGFRLHNLAWEIIKMFGKTLLTYLTNKSVDIWGHTFQIPGSPTLMLCFVDL
jgi:hypothetical protein